MKSSLPFSFVLIAGVAIGCTSDSTKPATSTGTGGAARTGGTNGGLGGTTGSGGTHANGGSVGTGGSGTTAAVGGTVGTTSVGGAGAGGTAGATSLGLDAGSLDSVGTGGASGFDGPSATGGSLDAGGGSGGTTVTPVDAAAPAGQTISGTVDSDVQGEGRSVVLIWEVSSGSPDYAYKFGEGTVVNGRFSITLPGDPPAAAINSWGVGIAVVVVLPAGETLADGKLSTFGAADVAGVSSRHSVVWKAATLNLPSTPPADFWPLSFPAGYACGACTAKPDGGSFERFTPSACDHIQITTYNIDEMCNWT